jgi:anaerobic ribonucleoside-triphosphate reductase activating protein
MSVEAVMERLPATPVEGITVSGGEPFMQPGGLLALLGEARGRGLSVVVYTGFRIEELTGAARSCLELIDVLVDGAYEEEKGERTLLARGSANQRFHFLTGRYGIGDFMMPGKVEVTISASGVVTETGFSQILLSGE